MAFRIRPSSNPGNSKGKPKRKGIWILVVLLLQVFAVLHVLNAPKRIPSPTVQSKEEDRSKHQQETHRENTEDERPQDDNGWANIHVFYGKRSALIHNKNEQSPRNETKLWYGQIEQDKVVMDLLGPNGYFVDLAANDAKEFSNTLALERYGWNGLCIEPNPVYWYGLSHRKCQVVAALVGGTQRAEPVTVKFRGVFGGIVGRMDDKLADRKREPNAEEEERFTVPLLEVFEKFKVPRQIDYMNLDVEGAEFLIMQHFPFEKYRIQLMTVERPKGALRRLLKDNGFVHLKSLSWWGETLWAHNTTEFTPEHPKVANISTA